MTTALMRLKVVLHEEDGGFWAEVPSLPGCYSQGRTLEDVRQNIAEAIQAHLETLQEESSTLSAGSARIEEVAV
ncbi:MAG: type II toxin-antitoxin system HicB family antitoxin [Verrucomicrobiota bacterium]